MQCFCIPAKETLTHYISLSDVCLSCSFNYPKYNLNPSPYNVQSTTVTLCDRRGVVKC